jgi:FkbM family methyltransferase
MLSRLLKRIGRRAFAACGYVVRDVGRGVQGVELLHDARILLGNASQPVLFDVGANIRQTTRAMLATFTSPMIRAFEPSPSTVKSLRRAVGGHPGVTEGTFPFHVTRGYSVNDSLLAPTWNAGDIVVDVPVETIDNYCNRRGIQTISLLKIDAQGYDLRVLKGARRMFEEHRIKLYSCEANFEEMYHGQTNLRELLGFADCLGYRLVGFYEQTYVKNKLSYLDALFFSG